MQKRFYILFVARGDDGQLRKISIPVHYLYVFVVGAAIGFLSLTGIASSYTRMLLKVSQFNQLRTVNAAKGQTALVKKMLEVSTCPDFIEDKGHYYGHQLSDQDKQALIEYMKYF